MSSTSESSLSPSPSPPGSPAASYHGPPNLASLVLHFVSAKRSLTSTAHVFGANELVTSSRSLIEEIAILNAKNAYGRRGLDDQVDTLDAIRDAVVEDGDKVADEFSKTLADLDVAHARLEKTLKTLRKTVVTSKPLPNDESQQSELSGSKGAEAVEERTLFTFIDEENHETILASLRELIDSYHVARGSLDNNFTTLDESLKQISDKLSGEGSAESSGPPDRPTIYDEPPPTIQQLFRDMEDHATEMATLLDNLVKHYDLCVNALKHTEGGGEAARIAVQAEELGKSNPGMEESLYRKTVAEPISDEERTEMLHVLQNDALQVEDVVIEIRDRAGEMEDFYRDLTGHARKARLRNQNLREVLDLMHHMRSTIPIHLDAATKFRETWQSIHTDIQSKTKELADLSVFYEQFLSGYSKLLREVERRRIAEAQMRKVAEKARREIERLYDMDRGAREEFMEDVGHFLPRDLGAFHGLEDEASRWEIRMLEEECSNDNGQSRLHDGS